MILQRHNLPLHTMVLVSIIHFLLRTLAGDGK